MKKLILLSCIYFFIRLSFYPISSANAQGVGINSSGSSPNSTAALDVDFTNKGMLIPRISLSSTSDVSTIATPATYLTVYNTNAAMTNGNGPGMYYWNGSNWVYMAAASNGPGTSGQVLTSGGAGTPAIWATPTTAGCPAAGIGETLINYNGCLYVKNVDQPGTYIWADALTSCTGLGAGWYLPSKMELDVLYQNWNANGQQCQGGTCPLSGFNFQGNYWSSTVLSAAHATGTYFGNGNLPDYSKSNTYYVRCVRR